MAEVELDPTQAEADELQRCAAQFYACPLVGLRKRILLSFAGAVLLLVFLGVLLSLPRLAGGALGMGVLAAAGYFVITGWGDNTHLFQKCRHLVLGAGRQDWLMVLGAGLLGLLTLWVFGFLWIWFLVAFVAIGAAAALYGLVDRRIAAWRAEPLRQAKEIADRMGAAGQEESAIHREAAKAGGERWEEFFEALFGYEAMIAARAAWGRGDDGRDRPRFRPWRDPILRWIDDRLRARREAEEQKVPDTYAVQASDVPDKRETQYRALLATMEGTADKIEKEPTAWARFLDAAAVPLGVVFGQRARFLWGCVLVAGCLLWAHQNGILRQPSQDEWKETLGKLDDLRSTIQQSDAEDALAKSEQLAVERSGRYKPLDLPLLPTAVTAVFDSFNPGIAGLVLILAAFAGGLKISLFVFPAAAVMLLAHTTGILGLVPPLGNSFTSLTAGLIVAVLGFLFGRS